MRIVKFGAIGAIVYSAFYVQNIYALRFLLLYEISMYLIVFGAYYVLCTLKPIHRDPNIKIHEKIWAHIDFSVGIIAFVVLGDKSLGCLFFLETLLFILYHQKIKVINGLLDE